MVLMNSKKKLLFIISLLTYSGLVFAKTGLNPDSFTIQLCNHVQQDEAISYITDSGKYRAEGNVGPGDCKALEIPIQDQAAQSNAEVVLKNSKESVIWDAVVSYFSPSHFEVKVISSDAPYVIHSEVSDKTISFVIDDHGQ